MTSPRPPIWARVLLRLLPESFRHTYGDELGEVIANRRGRSSRRGLREAAALLTLAINLRRPSARASLDWRSSARYLARHRAVSIAVVVTLAVGFTAVLTTAGLGDAVLWRPLPFPAPDRLVFAWEDVDRPDGRALARVTPARYVEWRNNASAIADVAAFGAAGLTIDSGEGRRTIRGLRVTPAFFDVLGLTPRLGRTFDARDEDPGASRVIVLSDHSWRRDFGADEAIVGRAVRFGDEPYTVIGVMPDVLTPGWPSNPAVVSLDRGQREFWVPIPATPQFLANARSHVLGVVARVKDGRAPADVNDALARPSDGADAHSGAVTPFRQQFVRDKSRPLAVLLAAAVAVLLIAVANIAGLQAAQFERRRGEMAIRAALGASRARIVRQLAGEALLLTSTAMAIAIAGTRVFLTWLPSRLPASVPILTSPHVDLRLIVLAVGLAGLTAAALAAWPALQMSRRSPAPRGVAVRGRGRVFRALVVGQVAVTVGLASASLLLGRSLQNIYAEDVGFQIGNMLVADIGLSTASATEDSVNARTAEVIASVARVPGVQSGSVAYDHPLEANWVQGLRLIGESPDASAPSREGEMRIVSPGYFETVGLDVLDGRAFTDDDGLSRPGVALINESMSRAIGGRVLGRRFDAGSPSSWGPSAKPEFEIIGIVKDERFRGLESPSGPAFYLSTLQFPQPSTALIVRTGVDPRSLAASVRAAVARAVPGTTVDNITSLDRILADQLAARLATTTVVTGFGVGAVALACLGLYGLMAMVVDDRRREFGLRVALGASPAALAGRVVSSGLRSTAIGIAAGVAISLATGRLVGDLLVDVDARDPLILAIVAVGLLALAAVATLVPALRASRVDPVTAMKAE